METKRQFDQMDYGLTKYGLTEVKKAPSWMFDLVPNMPL